MWNENYYHKQQGKNLNEDNPVIKKRRKVSKDQPRYLLLYNDDSNTFEFVINTLIDICEHSEVQAEQCAMITHHKGSCDIKIGSKELLKSLQNKLINKGLTATIE